MGGKNNNKVLIKSDEFKYCCQRACIEHIVVLLLLITSYGVYYGLPSQ